MVNKNNLILLSIVSLIYITLPLLILSGILSFDNKFLYLTVGAVIVYIAMRILGFNNQELGIATKGIRESIKKVIPITIILTILGLALIYFRISRFHSTETIWFYLFYLFISSPIQEFLYRGALTSIFRRMNLSDSRNWIMSSLLYSFVHIIYRDFLTCLLTFAIGLIWYKKYEYNRNLIGVSLSHAVLGAITIFTGIID